MHPISETLRSAREELVRRHTDCENRHDFIGALGTFHRPRYDVVATGEIHDGGDAVAQFYRETDSAFPTFWLDLLALHHGDDTVVAEVRFTGAQLGAWRGLPPTGRLIEYRFIGLFEFEEDRLICERLYFDLLTQLKQAGIARDPTTLGGRIATILNHPFVVGRAMLRGLRRPSRYAELKVSGARDGIRPSGYTERADRDMPT
jgi:predicted ester cyclase